MTEVVAAPSTPAAAERAHSMRHNNFDIVRILLALTVVLVHAYDLSARPELAMFATLLNAHMAVEGFFVISGFLIVASYDRSRSLRDYWMKRARRILPGYWFATLLCITIAACFNPHLHPLSFLIANLSFLNFLHPGITGVFEHNPGGGALNGALWTLKTEVLFYALVPTLVYACRRYGHVLVLSLISILSIVFRMVSANHGYYTISLQLPGQMSFFCFGALGYYELPFFNKWARLLFLLSLLTYLAYFNTGLFPLRAFFIPVITLFVSLSLPQFKGPTRWGDFSYGTYVLHWPIIQTLVALGLFSRSPWLAMCVVLLLVCGAAVTSWFLVEARWLKRKPAKSQIAKALAIST